MLQHPLIPGGRGVPPSCPGQACVVTWSTLRQETSQKQCGGRRHTESLASVPQTVRDTALPSGALTS